MSARKKFRIEAGLAGTVLAFLLVAWRATTAVPPSPSAVSMQVYGGTLPPSTTGSLEFIIRELGAASRVLDIGSNGLRFRDCDGIAREYRFSGGSLWRDRTAVVSRVKAFHFEYRDDRGNLLTCRKDNLQNVRTVTYLIRLETEGPDILAKAGISFTGRSPSTFAYSEAGTH
jgi:hypothetical protein